LKVSFGSILTAIGHSEQLSVLIAAFMFAMIVMIYFVELIGRFIHKHPAF
jgi:predicted tellurium resistance membrane protein TerC